MKQDHAVQETASPSVCTRRSFLTGTAALVAAAGTASLTSCAPKETKQAEKPGVPTLEPVEEDVYPGSCRSFCNGGCSLNLHVRDGKLVRTSMREMDDPVYNRICQKGYTHPYRVYSAERLTAPLKRTGERGSGSWEQISWDEAIAEIAEKWKAIADESGPGAIAAAGLTGNFGGVGGNGTSSIYARFKKATGVSTLANAVDAATKYVCSRMMGASFFNTANEPRDLANAKTIFIWGANPAVSQMQIMHFITEAHQNGANVVTIDPLYNANAALSDKYVPIRSATDGALALGMMNIVLQQGWEDVDFITNHTVAPFLVKPDTHKFLRLSDLGKAEAGSDADVPVVMDAEGNFDTPDNIAQPVIEGTVDLDGQTLTTAYSLLRDRIAEWPASRASEATGIPEADIEELARLYACETPSTIHTCFGADHYYNGHWNYSCMVALALLTGNVGVSGAGIGVCNAAGTNALNMKAVTDVPSPVEKAKSIQALRLEDAIVNHTYNDEPCELHGMYVAYVNPVANVADRTKTIEAFKALDLLVVTDMTMSETAEYADYVLPCCHWFECEDIMSTMVMHSCLVYQAPALEPLGESKPDFEIIKLLADALGYGEHFQFTTKEWIEMLLDTDDARSMNLSYDALKEKGTLKRIPTKDKPYVFAEGGVFPTPTKRAAFYLEDPKASNDYKPDWDFEKEYLPYWEEALEVGVNSPAREKFPLQLISEHSRFRTHVQWYDVEALLEVDAEQYVYIGPEDAASYGIATGDKVKVHNDRGYLIAHALIRPNNPPGILSAVKGWTASQSIDGHLSNLGTVQSNGFCANQPFNDCAVAIEKA